MPNGALPMSVTVSTTSAVLMANVTALLKVGRRRVHHPAHPCCRIACDCQSLRVVDRLNEQQAGVRTGGGRTQLDRAGGFECDWRVSYSRGGKLAADVVRS